MRAFVLLPLLAAASARAQDAAVERPLFSVSRGCEAGLAEALPTGPIAAPYHEADVATGRRACPRTEVGLGGQGAITLDTKNFYGGIEAAATVSGSYSLNSDTEVFGLIELFRSHYVAEATIDATEHSLGQTTVGATHIVYRSADEKMLLAPSVRLLLPTSFASNVRVIGGEVGLAYNHRLLERLELHGYAGFDGSMGLLTPAAAYPRGGALINFGAQYNVASMFGFVVDVNGHLLRRDTLDYLAPALGLRFRFGRVGLEVGASKPLAGADLRFVSGLLKLTHQF